MPGDDFSHLPDRASEERARFWSSWGAAMSIAVGAALVALLALGLWWFVSLAAEQQ